MPAFICDACGAVFEVKLGDPGVEVVFCPECGESEDIRLAEDVCGCESDEDTAGVSQRCG